MASLCCHLEGRNCAHDYRTKAQKLLQTSNKIPNRHYCVRAVYRSYPFSCISPCKQYKPLHFLLTPSDIDSINPYRSGTLFRGHVTVHFLLTPSNIDRINPYRSATLFRGHITVHFLLTPPILIVYTLTAQPRFQVHFFLTPSDIDV